MKFTKSKRLIDVKDGELFVHKFVHTLLVCVRTANGYRHLLVVDRRGVNRPSDTRIKHVNMYTGLTQPLTKARLLEFTKQTLGDLGKKELNSALRLFASFA